MTDLTELSANASDDLKKLNPEIFGVALSSKCPVIGENLMQTGHRTVDLVKDTTEENKASKSSKNRVLESDLQKQVIKDLQGIGYKVLVTGKARLKRKGQDVYVTPYQADGKGFPDCFAVKGTHSAALELKTVTGKLTPEQANWLLALSKIGAYTAVVTPENWEEIFKQIKERIK